MKTKTYQNSIAVLFALAWGLVLLDRNAISFLFPILMKEFNLNNAQTGQLVMVTGFGFVIASLFITPLADKTGLKKIWLVPVIILSGVFSGSTAVANSLAAMLLVRFLTGFADGPIYPLMTSVLKVQGDPKRFASYIGLSQFSIGLIAMILGPTLTIQLALHLNWRYAFLFTSLPAVIVGIIIWFVMKEVRPGSRGAADGLDSETQSQGEETMKWRDVPRIFAYRNCTLSYIANVLVMVGFWGVVSFGTTYWATEGGLTLAQTGYLSSISGVVGLGWAIVIPIIVDRLGRKPSSILFTLFIALSMLILYLNQGLPAQISYVMVLGCCGFTSVLFVAIICQESVPPAIGATTTAIGMAIGEFFGTAIAPRVLGSLGDMYGLRTIFLVAAISTALAFFISLGLIETRKPAHKQDTVEAAQ
ncbi:MAG: MFS transporter [Acidobacteria bacterium]|nr:MFS transporter [Acidobacteriota bacterium]